MKIEREILQSLAEWKLRKDRKPLILQGARQTGKTWVMKNFGERHFEHTAYFSLERNEELYQLFETTKDPKRLIVQLKAYTSAAIEPQKTLIVFDEIQECNKALNALKYFCEEMPEYAIIAAGSLLGVSMSRGNSFPVGKVDFLQMYPLTFKEFLASDAQSISVYMEKMLTGQSN